MATFVLFGDEKLSILRDGEQTSVKWKVPFRLRCEGGEYGSRLFRLFLIHERCDQRSMLLA